MRRRSGPLRAAVVLLSILASAPPAQAADGPVLGPDGATAPVFDYREATRQRAFIPVPGVDSDADGVTDRVVADVLRPVSTNPATRFPAIIDPSPYFTTLCRGNEAQCLGDVDGDGLNDRWPLFYDDYFVPRGYAYVLGHAVGTGAATGCVQHGGPDDIAGQRAIVDWLNNRIPGYGTVDGTDPVVADWHSGSAAMIGKSYDGTFANGVAATGVEGLDTVVPITAISDWYKYSRQNGLRFNTDYPASLSNTVTNPDRRAGCQAVRDRLSAADGDETGDVNPFWDLRNHLLTVNRVRASVFAVQGLQDDNVKMDHLQAWWEALGRENVTRKLWLMRTGHVDPFDGRRGEWVRTLHRWFDSELLDVDNGITEEPAVDVEETADRWQTSDTWPVAGTADTTVHLRGTAAATAGALALGSGGALDTVRFTNAPTQTEAQVIDTPTGPQTARRMFLSAPLKADLRLSGTPRVDLRATLDTDQANLAAVLVDYGGGEQVQRSGEGMQNTADRTCWGTSPAGEDDFSACYLEQSKRTGVVSSWRVSRGVLDSSNRDSVAFPSDVTPGVATRFGWPMVPTDHVFRRGHQIGIAIVGDYRTLTAPQLSRNPDTDVTVDVKASTVSLPLVGGYGAAVASGAFVPDTTAPAMRVSDDLTVAATDADGAAVDYAAPGVTDDTDPAPAASCAPASGERFPMGATTVSCTGTDASGNTSRASFRVTVSPGATGTAPGGELPAPPAPEVSEARTPVPPAPDPGTVAPTPRESPTLDVVGPRVSGLAVGRRAVRLSLSRAARVTVTVRRGGRAVRRVVRRVRAGRTTLRMTGARLPRGRYRVVIDARDAAGARTRVVRTVRVR